GRGYALMLVLIFLVLSLSMASVAYRELAGILRVESARTTEDVRDQGSLEALARALALLETGTPPSNPYVVGVIVNTPNGERELTITMASLTPGVWTINSAPTTAGESPSPMPSTFQVQP